MQRVSRCKDKEEGLSSDAVSQSSQRESPIFEKKTEPLGMGERWLAHTPKRKGQFKGAREVENAKGEGVIRGVSWVQAQLSCSKELSGAEAILPRESRRRNGTWEKQHGGKTGKSNGYSRANQEGNLRGGER